MPGATEFGYADFSFAWGDHICAIFDTRVQQMEIMGAFVATGIRAEQRCVWVSPEDSAASLREALGDMGGDLPTLEASGQLVIISQIEFYLEGGVFDPDRTLRLLRTLLDDNRREGYSAMRFANDVSWLSEGRIDLESWESFENTMTQEIPSFPVTVVCQYDRRQVSGDIVVMALRTHPTVILGDTFRRNPFYVPAGLAASDGGHIL